MPSLPPAIDLHVHERGSGPLVVGLHDLGSEGMRMQALLGGLVRRGHRLVTPDLRGHGRSPSPHGPWSIDDVASDVARVVASRGAPAIVVGQGLGAAAAVAMALGHPGLVNGLVLAGLTPRAEEPETQDRWMRVARALRERDREGVALAAEAMAARPDWRGALPQLDAPAIVLAGARDRAAPPDAQRDLAVWIRRARLTVVDAGHDVAGERPDLVMEAVLRLEATDREAVAA
ncbi:MAG TPA: alpha/beta fold hydrolase [Miltoncostaeaceae bacterium]|nr:alpha/beta fold hydrolase [Miltoncostaeaceae bacterium]